MFRTTMVLLCIVAMPAAIAHADNMKAFQPAKAGMTRHVLRLPKQDKESDFRVELIVGKTVKIDSVNR